MSDDLSKKTDEELARIQAINHPLEEAAILSRQELQKRIIERQHELNEKLMLKQHDLNKEIVKKQISTMKAAIVATLVGAIVGAILTTYLPKLELLWKPQAQSIQPQQGILPTTESTVRENLAPH